MAGPLGVALWFSGLGMTQAEFMKDPYPIYREWRKEHPVWETGDHLWFLLNYEDVKRVLTDPIFMKGDPWTETPPEAYRHLPELSPSMLVSNPPVHTRLRGLVSQAFQPRHLKRLEPFILSLAEKLSSSLYANGGGDLVSEFCFPLPALVIAELLGVPERDQAQFRTWSQGIARLLDPSQTPEVRAEAVKSRWALLDYFHHLIEQKRTQPQDDLLTELIQAESDGHHLTPGELLSMSLLLLVAGHETTTNLLSMGSLALIEHPQVLPPEGQWQTAVEELLRYTSPVQIDGRTIHESIDLGSIRIPAESWLTVSLGAANRDPSIFNDPEHIDLARSPNPHMAFGRGIHFCLGAGLARMEANIAFPILWRKSLKLVKEPSWNENIVLRGLSSLSVTFS